MKEIKVNCHMKDCRNYKLTGWPGGFIKRWYCRTHAYMYLEDWNKQKNLRVSEKQYEENKKRFKKPLKIIDKKGVK